MFMPARMALVEEGGVHRLADGVVASEGKRQVGDAARDQGAGADLLQDARRLDVIPGELGVLLDAGGDGQDVGIEDDVVRAHADDVEQEPVGAAADLDLALDGLGLPLLVEGHDHHTAAEAPDLARLGEEVLLALLEADRVHHPLALHAAHAGLQHRPLGAVDHDGQARESRARWR
jgi:hypothetical protein